MKIVAIVWLVLAFLLVVVHRACFYWLGYAESPNALAVTDSFFLLMAEFALFLLFFFPAIWGELARKKRFWSYIALLGYWPVIILGSFLVNAVAPPGDLIIHGLRDRIMGIYKPEELHQFAQEIIDAKFLQDLDLVNPANLADLTFNQRRLYYQLAQKYPFMQWMNPGDSDTVAGACLLDYGQNGMIAFEWGGGNRGRWGCSISTKGKNEVIPIPGVKVLRATDDIYFYYRR